MHIVLVCTKSSVITTVDTEFGNNTEENSWSYDLLMLIFTIIMVFCAGDQLCGVGSSAVQGRKDSSA